LEDKKKNKPISDLENPVRIILIWCGKQDWILTARRRSVRAALSAPSLLPETGTLALLASPKEKQFLLNSSAEVARSALTGQL